MMGLRWLFPLNTFKQNDIFMYNWTIYDVRLGLRSRFRNIAQRFFTFCSNISPVFGGYFVAWEEL